MPRVLTLVALVLACSPEQVGCEPRRTETIDERGRDGVHVEVATTMPRGDGSAIEYTLHFPDPQTHHVEVDAVFPAGQDDLLLMMPVWTPGSYLVREYARHIEHLEATSLEGEPLFVEKVAKNRWRVYADGTLPGRVVVRYRLYAHDLTVRTNFIDRDLAVLNGAPTFLTLVGAHLPHDVELDMPAFWERCLTALGEVEPNHWRAADYDELVDSPIVCGSPEVTDVQVRGVTHRLATFDGGEVWDQERAARDVARIIDAQHLFWRVVPYRNYTFLNVLVGSGGGLEHRASTLVMGDRWAARDETDYRRWLGLVSHEFFHTWNVKRLRPAELARFDYERENYTRSLWIVEGITSYYDDLIVRRAGLMSRADYLRVLSAGIERLADTPGRHVQPLSMASFDAWIKFYRPDENSSNSTVSYYGKGALVAFLLDVAIREQTTTESLDDVMRLAYERFSGETGYTPAQFRALVSEVAGVDMSDFFARYVDGTDDLDFEPAFHFLGLRFRPPEEDAAPKAWLGVHTQSEDGRIVVSGVPHGSPAYQAGINVGDELLAIDDERLPEAFVERIERYVPGETAQVLVARRGHLRRIEVTFGARPIGSFQVEVDPRATPVQRRSYQAWIGPEQPRE